MSERGTPLSQKHWLILCKIFFSLQLPQWPWLRNIFPVWNNEIIINNNKLKPGSLYSSFVVRLTITTMQLFHTELQNPIYEKNQTMPIEHPENIHASKWTPDNKPRKEWLGWTGSNGPKRYLGDLVGNSVKILTNYVAGMKRVLKKKKRLLEKAEL